MIFEFILAQGGGQGVPDNQQRKNKCKEQQSDKNLFVDMRDEILKIGGLSGSAFTVV